jgi:hypothetical protein
VNLVMLGRMNRPEQTGPILAGAILPDLPMLAFYLYAKMGRGLTEGTIWSQVYFETGWQAFFDLFNSVPLIIAALLAAHLAGARRLAIFFASMMLHVLFDLPLHNADAHHHFFPFSDWQFRSPISYWDPRHHGTLVALLEIAGFVVCGIVLARRFRSARAWGLLACCALFYLVYGWYALWMWG